MRWFQERAQRVTGKLPAKALCFICSQSGESEEEKPAGAASYKGKTYYFCNKGEVERFLKDPEAYLPAPVPRPAPPFALKTPSGETVTLESLKGKLILVDFWATWCVPCVKAMPELQKLHEKYSARGLTVLGVSLDEEGAKKVVPFLAKSRVKFTYPILLNGETIWQAWGVKSVPSVLLVKDGQILQHWSGQIDTKELERAIQTRL
ncbi:redoxin domain-containing protein [Armatimonas rosea]|uniref:Thiol-disulfide isomerase/thioredoxin n=1 Tax=Armatimonas rosea TaxID=685828 RepID=A0A7W9SVP6_ARMRO|nr:redoxin domain-containing protein [Armatimonas rosea]MBB6053727.1 thiol-disulfide isomerase/thioredoxin [Armatimonas rosea]